ncbi:DUF3833 domain-containing protein [Crenobacter cavernae]|uniref:DUF3833 domain-containing protein n=1 Tax=Crenobacter cavernae TaxID=2290923 RepID=A0ABY0FC20_9NEIS|nr:DUF3833 domain-containing protein [Crenobacter cavernae]RXZ43534.1 DUF3833 domain-containing protein [Crenobacter cavernae]
MKTPARTASLVWPLLALTLLPADSGNARIDDYRSTRPRLDLARYFDGPVSARGLFQDRSGKVVRRFTVQIYARWAGGTGTLDERFVYDNGERRRLVWTLKKRPDGRYTATAADVVGEAEGRMVGHAFNWSYTLKLSVGGQVVEVDFEDWMYQLDEATVINRSELKKYGLRVGEMTLFFRKGARS